MEGLHKGTVAVHLGKVLVFTQIFVLGGIYMTPFSPKTANFLSISAIHLYNSAILQVQVFLKFFSTDL